MARPGLPTKKEPELVRGTIQLRCVDDILVGWTRSGPIDRSISIGTDNFTPRDRREHLVDRRAGRQNLLAQDEGPFLHCIVDEAVLRRPVGGPATMRAQLTRIVEVASLPSITFQVMPFDVGAYPGLDSNFTIFSSPRPW